MWCQAVSCGVLVWQDFYHCVLGIKLFLKVYIRTQLLITLVAFLKQLNFSAKLSWEGESTQYNCWLRKLQRHFCARCLGFRGFCFCGICFYCSPASLSWMQLSSDENPMQWEFRSWWIKNISFFVLVVVILYDAVVVDSFPSQGSKNFYGHAWSGPGALEVVQTPPAITSTNSFSILLLLILKCCWWFL